MESMGLKGKTIDFLLSAGTTKATSTIKLLKFF